MSDLTQKCMKCLKFKPLPGYLINYSTINYWGTKSGWGPALGVCFICAVYLKYLCININFQLFFIWAFWSCSWFSYHVIFSPFGVAEGNNVSFFPWSEVGVWLWPVCMHAVTVPNLTHYFILFLFPIRKWRVWLKDASLHHLWSLSKHSPDLDRPQGESVSFAGCTVLQFLNPKLEIFFNYCPHQVVEHNSGSSVAAWP